jgi:branched-chain amino acid transport system permease protein
MFNLTPSSRSNAQGQTLNFAPANIGRAVIWALFAALLIVMPLIFTKGFALTLLSQMGIWIIMCLAYNMLFGQGGMLSFGHAVYSGLGAFFAVHAINLASGGKLPIPLTLIPLVGGVFGALFGVLFGYVTTKKSGTPFAMITLGIGEMVFVATQMFPGFFGGEGGVTTNRVFGEAFMGITYGSATQVYYLIAAWTFICVAGMFAFSRTPLGRISNAVRENPERVEFFGYNTQYVRFIVLIASAFFSGIAGGLSAINFEIVSGENVHAIRSGGVLLATFIGGSLFFFGPILGAVIFAFFSIALSEYTKAWQFYLGTFFVLMVMFAPGGLAGILLTNLRVMKFGLMKRLRQPYVWLLLTGAILSLAIIALIEIGYHLSLESAGGTTLKLFGSQVDAGLGSTWIILGIVLLAASAAFEWARRRFAKEWGSAQELIEAQIKRESGS